MIICSEFTVSGWGGPPAGIDPNVYQWFLTVDADRSGRINMMELQQALVNANWTHFNPETCRLMIGESVTVITVDASYSAVFIAEVSKIISRRCN